MNLLSRSMVISVLAISQFAVAQDVKTQTAAQATTTTTTVVVEQPTTTVEATPLEESQAERLRKRRQEHEIQTEQKIVEKLEESRLEDEKKRADRLFGNKLGPQEEEKKVEAAPAPVYQQQEMPQQQVVVPVETEKKVSSDELNSAKKEIIDAIKEEKASVSMEIPKEEPPRKRYYISGAVGTADYPDASNIEGQGAAGFTVGSELDERVIVEASLMYSNYFMDDYRWVTGQAIFKELDQYNIGLGVKYGLLTGKIKPFVGASMSYTYRKYFDRLVYTWSGGYIPQENEATSNAFDLGLILGLDVAVSEGFSVGVEYRYNTNLIYRNESEILSRQYRAAGTQLVEETDYSLLLISGKIRF
ncbi:MAG: outer membrane beta-barrel protein [Bdellovibrionales bacterium]